MSEHFTSSSLSSRSCSGCLYSTVVFRFNHRSLFISLSLQTATRIVSCWNLSRLILFLWLHLAVFTIVFPPALTQCVVLYVDKCQGNLEHYPAVHRCFPPRRTGALPRHAARRWSVHFPGGVQVHVHRPIGGDRHRFGGLRRRYASSPREPSPLRHAGRTLCLKTMKENPNKTAVCRSADPLLQHNHPSTRTEARLDRTRRALRCSSTRRSPLKSLRMFLKLR